MKYTIEIEIDGSELDELESYHTITKITPTKKYDPNYVMDVLERPLYKTFGLTPKDLKSKNKSNKYILPRYMVIAILKVCTDLNFNELARFFNKNSHATIKSALENVENLLDTDSEFKKNFVYLYKYLEDEEIIHKLIELRSWDYIKRPS